MKQTRRKISLARVVVVMVVVVVPCQHGKINKDRVSSVHHETDKDGVIVDIVRSTRTEIPPIL